MANLYQIQGAFAALLAEIEEAGGELTPETEAALALNDADFASKAESYAQAIANYDADARAFVAEINRLQARRAAAENTADRLRERLRAALIARGGQAVEVGTFRLSLRKSTAVDVVDAKALPSKFKAMEYVEKIDKKAIGEAIKSGEEIPGARLDVRQNLQIK